MARPLPLPFLPMAALLSALGATSCGGDAPVTWSGTVEFDDVRVGSLVGGRVSEVPAAEGEIVAAGQVLLRLDPSEWNTTLAEAEAGASAAARRLDLLLAGTRPEVIAQAEAEADRRRLLWQAMAAGSRPEEVEEARRRVDAARADRDQAEADHRRKVELLQGGAGSAEEAERARNRLAEADATVSALEMKLRLLEAGFRAEEVQAAEASHRQAVLRLQELRAGPRPEEIAAARADAGAAEARAAFVRSKIAELTVAAPAAALVQTLDLRPGDIVAPGAPAAVLLLLDRCRMTIWIPEDRIAAVSPGQAATVTFDGLPEPFEARVVWMSREAEFTPRNVQTRSERVTQVFAVRLALEGRIGSLKDGLWGDVRLR